MLESDFTRWFKKLIEDDGGIVIPLVGGMMSSGWPDRLVYHRDWHGLVELKNRTRKLTDRQRINIKRLNGRVAGGAVVVREADQPETGLVQTWSGKTLGQFVCAGQFIALCEVAKTDRYQSIQ